MRIGVETYSPLMGTSAAPPSAKIPPPCASSAKLKTGSVRFCLMALVNQGSYDAKSSSLSTVSWGFPPLLAAVMAGKPRPMMPEKSPEAEWKYPVDGNAICCSGTVIPPNVTDSYPYSP